MRVKGYHECGGSDLREEGEKENNGIHVSSEQKEGKSGGRVGRKIREVTRSLEEVGWIRTE